MPLSKVVSNSLSLTTLTSSGAGSIQGLTVGKGANAVARNTAFGITALAAATGNFNTGIGNLALLTNSTGATNTAVGDSALKLNTTGGSNTAIGQGALESNTTASNNAAVGKDTLASNTTGASNTALGQAALAQNTTGPYNTAVGYQASYAGTTGERNTNLGYQAGYTPTTSSEHTFVGYKAGYAKTTGDACTFIGNIAGTAATTGIGNTFVGSNSGSTVTTGGKNTILGSYNGNQGSLDIRTASNYIVLSDGDGNPRGYFNSAGYFKATSTGSLISQAGSQHELFGGQADGYTLIVSSPVVTPLSQYIFDLRFSSSTPNNTSARFWHATDSTATRAYLLSNGGIGNYSANNVNLSDRREKTDFNPAGEYLSKICAVPVQTFKYLGQTDSELNLGVVAQDVQVVAPELVTESNWGTEENPKMRLSIYQTDLQYALMKCIQEQQALITQQATAITTLTTRITALEQA